MKAGRRSFSWAAARQRVHFVLEGGVVNDRVSRFVHQFLVALTLVSVAGVVLDSVKEFRAGYGQYFAPLELFAVIVFTTEYLVRLWSAPENIAYHNQKSWRARLHYSVTFSAVIDLLSILPLYLSVFIADDFRVLMLIRVFRFFKVTRYSPGMRSLLAALKSEQRALFACAVILLGLVLVTAAAMHVVEPDPFDSIPKAMWFSIVTLTTVGYGDLAPQTVGGRMIASATMIMGLMMVALPVGIIATAFANEIHRRDFVVNWAMLARMPLFSSLKADEIAEIMPYLRSKTVAAGNMVVRKGEVAQSMFFITSGEVSVEIPSGSIRLGEGQFFGEMAILRQSRRSADVRATQVTKLLVLDAADFHSLVERNPDIGRRVSEVADKRATTKPHEPPAGSQPPG